MLLLAIDSCNDVHRSGTRSRKFNMLQNVRISFSSDLCKYFALYGKICVYRCMPMYYKKLQNKQIRIKVFKVCVYAPLLHQHGQ